MVRFADVDELPVWLDKDFVVVVVMMMLIPMCHPHPVSMDPVLYDALFVMGGLWYMVGIVGLFMVLILRVRIVSAVPLHAGGCASGGHDWFRRWARRVNREASDGKD